MPEGDAIEPFHELDGIARGPTRHAIPQPILRRHDQVGRALEWIAEVNRYIHLNPVRMESLAPGKQRQAEERRGVDHPGEEKVVRERLERLRQYAWSPYRAAIYFPGCVVAAGKSPSYSASHCGLGQRQCQMCGPVTTVRQPSG